MTHRHHPKATMTTRTLATSMTTMNPIMTNYRPKIADNDAADPVHYDEADRERMLDMQNPTGPYETV